MDLQTYVLFALTTLVVVASPGPAALTATAQGSGNGVRGARFAIAGIALANAIYFGFSAMGIASIIIASPRLFGAIKWLGVAYLVYLGLSALLTRSGGLTVERAPQSPWHGRLAKGFLVEFANPKALLFFAAIVPQFLDADHPIVPQFLAMGATTVVLDLFVYSVYAYLGDFIARAGVRDWIVRGLNRAAGIALLVAAFEMTGVR